MAKQLTIISTLILNVPDDFEEERDMGRDLNITDMIEFMSDIIDGIPSERIRVKDFSYSIGTMIINSDVELILDKQT